MDKDLSPSTVLAKFEPKNYSLAPPLDLPTEIVRLWRSNQFIAQAGSTALHRCDDLVTSNCLIDYIPSFAPRK
jgi:hypothetical protein